MIYGATIALSAFLLFVVQPTIAKQILPWFGGAAAVWTTCMVFFQILLLAGYAYSDLISRRLALRRQVLVHVTLLVVSLLTLPIVAPVSLKPDGSTEPMTRVLAVLGLTVGLPYFLLSTTGPLVQAWWARRFAGQRVYRLYALSNAASIMALGAYPAIIEPWLPTRMQALSWSGGYVVFVLLAVACAMATQRASGEVSAAERPSRASPVENHGEDGFTTRNAVAVLALAALGSVLLLAITAHITRDVASIPFLWMAPLILYLLTFVLCFDGRDWYRRSVFLPLGAALVVAMLAVEQFRTVDLWLSLPVHAVGLFVCCMVCHGEVVLRRPHERSLTTFYLMISLGGAIGGLFVGILAPLLFSANLELPLALCGMGVVLYLSSGSALRFVGAVALMFAVGFTTASLYGARRGAVALSRNFYGALRVSRASVANGSIDLLRLSHGVILHGQQFVSPELRATPTSYFGPTSGIGRTIALLRPGSLRIGIVGLGTGTLAAYAVRGDHVKYYELDPEVERYARTYFHFLADSPAEVQVALGDARLTLERETAQHYDLIVVDAFSSDAIPVHLLTREALAVYEKHLAVDGVIAFHVSNRYLDLVPVVSGVAAASGMRAYRIRDDPRDVRGVFYPSLWVVATRKASLLRELGERKIGELAPPQDSMRVWTDDYSNLFSVLRFQRESTAGATAARAR